MNRAGIQRYRWRSAVAGVALGIGVMTSMGTAVAGPTESTEPTETTATEATMVTTELVATTEAVEAYPPQPTVETVPPRPLPATGNDGTENWLRYGAGAIVVGGLLVAGTARRRRTGDMA